MKRELWLAVDQLPDRLPAAIRLRYESGLTYKEMGERLGVDMNQARSLEQKAFKKLRIPSRAKRFRAYHEEYLSASQIHHVGVRRFNETWTSEVERDAIREMLLDGRKKKGGVKMNRGRKDGNEMKNHEGYYDPTAGKAIRRAHRTKRRGRGERNGLSLIHISEPTRPY